MHSEPTEMCLSDLIPSFPKLSILSSFEVLVQLSRVPTILDTKIAGFFRGLSICQV
jgi:hypothetical protein